VEHSQLVVLMMHIPIMELDEARALYALLKDFPHTFSLSAHTHVQENVFLGKADGWMQDAPHHHLNHGTACGSWWGGDFDELGIPMTPMADGGPNNYSFITFDGAKYDVDFRVPRRSRDYQMNVWLPERTPSAETAKTEVIANVFGGSSKSRVEMCVDGAKPWTPMSPFTGKDPYLAQAVGRHQDFVAKLAEIKGVKEVDKSFESQAYRDFHMALRKLSGPSDTGHLWKAHLPEGLAPGSHSLAVRTTDMFGRTYSAERIFVVAQ
jgi:hypothetical protein